MSKKFHTRTLSNLDQLAFRASTLATAAEDRGFAVTSVIAQRIEQALRDAAYAVQIDALPHVAAFNPTVALAAWLDEIEHVLTTCEPLVEPDEDEDEDEDEDTEKDD